MIINLKVKPKTKISRRKPEKISASMGLAEFFIQYKKLKNKQLINWTSEKLRTSVFQKTPL